MVESSQKSERVRHAAMVLVLGLGTLGVYILTLAPTVSGEDSGELIAAAHTLGIPHPTGYPLWCLLGKLFITIIPFGGVAWRVNFMSAVFGAATVSLVFILIRRLTRDPIAALAGALAFGFSWEFWEQAVIAEVYTLNAFFVALCLLLLLAWQEKRRTWHLLAFALAYGLSLCNHSTMFLLGPLFLAFMLWVDRGLWRRPALWAGMGVLVALGLCLYAYLPLRSRADPAIDWGNPET